MNTNMNEKQLIEGMKAAIALEAKCFLDLGRMALAAFNLKTQSMDKWALQLNVSKGTFNNWKQLGMALAQLKYTDAEMIRCGRSTMYRIGNVIANQGKAFAHADVVAEVITKRAARQIDDKTAAEMLAKLQGKGKGDEVGADEKGKKIKDERLSAFLKVVSKAWPHGGDAVTKATIEFFKA